MSPVSKKAASPAPTLPPEFSLPALQKLLQQGRTHGSVDSAQLREALEGADIAPKRMKVVLRSLDEQGIHVTLDAATASRAVAATKNRRIGVISYVMGDGVSLVSSAEECAKDVYRMLADSGLMKESGEPSYSFVTTGSPAEFETIGRRFLGPELAGADQFVGGLA